jgi:hypothetical protein
MQSSADQIVLEDLVAMFAAQFNLQVFEGLLLLLGEEITRLYLLPSA